MIKFIGQAAQPEIDHVQIRRLDTIRPSPENDKLYNPVGGDDPDLKAMAESIREHGVQEPLVVTADNWILSGHRRHAAAKLAGLVEVPCRINPIRRDTDPDGFLVLLREFNRQRVKSFDEVLREEVVVQAGEEPYQALQTYRREQARVKVAPMNLGGAKTRATITAAKRPLLEAIQRVLEEQRDFWPLSDRRVHYALLNDPPLVHASKPASTYGNDARSYRAAVDLLTRARLARMIPWEAIEDPTRPITIWKVHGNPGTFIREELDGFLKGYYRDLQKTQPNHVEVVVEKNTVEPIVKPVVADYCLALTSGRGYCSLAPRRDMAERFKKSGKDKLVLLLMSDQDPDGQEIAASLTRSLRDDFGIRDVAGIRVALTAKQVKRFRIPPLMLAKETSPQFAKFKALHGSNVYELEALKPADLQLVLREAIESVLNLDLLAVERQREAEDAAELDAVRRRVLKLLPKVTAGP